MVVVVFVLVLVHLRVREGALPTARPYRSATWLAIAHAQDYENEDVDEDEHGSDRPQSFPP